MGLVNKVVPLEQLEDEYVQWAEEMMLRKSKGLRMIKAGLNAELDVIPVFRNWQAMPPCFII